MIRISIAVPMPKPAQQEHRGPRCTPEEKVREAIDSIDSGNDSHVEWLLLNKLYKQMCELKRPSPRADNLKKMIEPVLQKFGYFGTYEK